MMDVGQHHWVEMIQRLDGTAIVARMQAANRVRKEHIRALNTGNLIIKQFGLFQGSTKALVNLHVWYLDIVITSTCHSRPGPHLNCKNNFPLSFLHISAIGPDKSQRPKTATPHLNGWKTGIPQVGPVGLVNRVSWWPTVTNCRILSIHRMI